MTLLRSTIQFLKDISDVAQGEVSPFLLLEGELMQECRTFYQQEADSWLSHGRLRAYCHQAARRLKEEWEWCMSLLGMVSAIKMLKIVSEELIERRLQDLRELEERPNLVVQLQDEERTLRLLYTPDARETPVENP
jgi:hypothetical protein